MRGPRFAPALAGLLACAVAAGCVDMRGPAGTPSLSAGTARPEEQGELWLIPSPAAGTAMQSRLFRPAGNGPFPLAVVNHGSEQDPIARARMGPPAFPALTEWLVGRGYAVLVPQRPGHGATGGPYLEDQGGCAQADFARSGRATADSIEAAVGHMLRQPFIRPDGVVVIGNSAGGWGALALAARNPAAIRAVVSFAGGRGGRDRGEAGRNCAPDRLVAAAAEFGRTARIPTLWLYAENDSYFPPDLSRRMAEAYRAAGGRADYRLLPAVGTDGHHLIDAPPASWEGPLGAYLDRAR